MPSPRRPFASALAIAIVCTSAMAAGSAPAAFAASAQASCAPSPARAAERLGVRASAHTRRATRLKRTARRLARRGRPAKARHARRAAARHRRLARRLRTRRKTCVTAARRADKPDRTAPTVSIKQPLAGAELTGVLNGSACEATASDAFGVDRVVFSVGGAPLNTERVAPYECVFDTTVIARTARTRSRRASMTPRANSSVASVSVQVANASATPAPTGAAVGVEGGIRVATVAATSSTRSPVFAPAGG